MSFGSSFNLNGTCPSLETAPERVSATKPPHKERVLRYTWNWYELTVSSRIIVRDFLYLLSSAYRGCRFHSAVMCSCLILSLTILKRDPLLYISFIVIIQYGLDDEITAFPYSIPNGATVFKIIYRPRHRSDESEAIRVFKVKRLVYCF
jgi:hypothetical protein